MHAGLPLGLPFICLSVANNIIYLILVPRPKAKGRTRNAFLVSKQQIKRSIDRVITQAMEHI